MERPALTTSVTSRPTLVPMRSDSMSSSKAPKKAKGGFSLLKSGDGNKQTWEVYAIYIYIIVSYIHNDILIQM